MKKFLIVYDSIQGQTEKIAIFIEHSLEKLGHEVVRVSAHDTKFKFRAKDYSGVLIGAPVHAGGYPKPLQKWVRRNAAALGQLPSVFFSVCLGVLQKDEKVQKELKRIIEDFFQTSGWQPDSWTVFAGGLAYSRYNWFLRKYMQYIAKKAGGDTDLSKDYEYTDWKEVLMFTVAFAQTSPSSSV